jgi:hypothetical protein
VIDGGKRTKFVLTGNAADLTADSIVSFVSDVVSGNSKEYKIDEAVVYAEAPKDEEL